jgi:ferredoxin
MDCVYDCPERETRFEWRSTKENFKRIQKDTGAGKGISRRDFLLLLLSAFSLAGLKARRGWSFWSGENATGLLATGIIRPPGALRESEFVDRCIRCGNCMKVCITNGLQPVMFETGLEGLWTPQLVPEIGYCEYHCTLCGNVCPTGAIPSLPVEIKKKTKLGLARIERSLCIPWSKNQECIVCEEHCPVSEKAIKLTGAGILKPLVDSDLCIGCGICQSVCPVRPVRAVHVFPVRK